MCNSVCACVSVCECVCVKDCAHSGLDRRARNIDKALKLQLESMSKPNQTNSGSAFCPGRATIIIFFLISVVLNENSYYSSHGVSTNPLLCWIKYRARCLYWWRLQVHLLINHTARPFFNRNTPSFDQASSLCALLISSPSGFMF